MFGPYFSTKALILLNREFNAVFMNEFNQGVKRKISFHFPVNGRNDILEAVTILFDEFFLQNFDCPVKLNFFFKKFGQFPFSCRFHNFIRHVVVSTKDWSLHFVKKLWFSICHVQLESMIWLWFTVHMSWMAHYSLHSRWDTGTTFHWLQFDGRRETQWYHWRRLYPVLWYQFLRRHQSHWNTQS